MIFGDQEKVQVVTFMPSEGPDDGTPGFPTTPIAHLMLDDEFVLLTLVWSWPLTVSRIAENPDRTIAIITGLTCQC